MRCGGMTILDALADPALFAPHFRMPTWAPWRTASSKFLSALPHDRAQIRPVHRDDEARKTICLDVAPEQNDGQPCLP